MTDSFHYRNCQFPRPVPLMFRCWMALAASVMTDLAAAVDERVDAARYSADLSILVDDRLLDHLHWSDELQSYADFGLHTDDVVLKRPPPPTNRRQGMPVHNSEKVRIITKLAICESSPTTRYWIFGQRPR